MTKQKKVLAIYCSPRRSSISGSLLNSALEPLQDAGLIIEKFFLREPEIHACIACGVCYNGHDCPFGDDMDDVYPILENCDAIIFATPVYFYAFPGTAKALIDRCQLFWARKYLLNNPLPSGRQAAIIATAAGGGEKSFDGIRLTYKYFLDSISIEMPEMLALKNCDFEPDEIPPDMLIKSQEYGRSFLERIIKGEK